MYVVKCTFFVFSSINWITLVDFFLIWFCLGIDLKIQLTVRPIVYRDYADLHKYIEEAGTSNKHINRCLSISMVTKHPTKKR